MDSVVHVLHLHAEALQTFRNLRDIDGETTAQTLIAQVGIPIELPKKRDRRILNARTLRFCCA